MPRIWLVVVMCAACSKNPVAAREEAPPLAPTVEAVDASRKSLGAVADAFDEAIHAADKIKALAAMGAVDVSVPAPEVVLPLVRAGSIEPGTAEELIELAYEARRLRDDLKEHLDRTKRDRALLEQGSAGAELRIGGVLRSDLPGEGPLRVELFELGAPSCDGKRPASGPCDGAPRGFLVRSDPGRPWSVVPLAEDGDCAPTGRLLPVGGPLVARIGAGAGPARALDELRRRAEDLSMRARRLVELARDLSQRLHREAARSG